MSELAYREKLLFLADCFDEIGASYEGRELRKVAADIGSMEAALKEKDAEIKSLKLLLSDCLDCFEHTPTRPIAVAIKKALEARDTTKHIVEPSPLTPEELAEYERECREEAQG